MQNEVAFSIHTCKRVCGMLSYVAFKLIASYSTENYVTFIILRSI